MYHGTARVDVLSLEDFHATLSAREEQAQAIVTKLTTELRGERPKLGTFQDGSSTSTAYGGIHAAQVARANQLLTAITAAKAATAAIISGYGTTEARNGANAGDIGSRLGGVTEALGERGTDG